MSILLEEINRRSYQREWYRNHRKRVIAQKSKYRQLYPWKCILSGIRQRCENPKCSAYHKYGAKGVKNLLTQDQIYFLWVRDGAAQMKHPSIDRIDPTAHYTLDNCRFLEQEQNSRLSVVGRTRRSNGTFS